MLCKNTIDPNNRENTYEHMTVGGLKKFIEDHNLPDDALIFIQRVEDVYFEEHNWSTVKKEGCNYSLEKEFLEKAKPGGEYHDKERYPKMTDEHIQDILKCEKYLDDVKEEYIMIWCPVKYKDDDNLYFDAHY